MKKQRASILVGLLWCLALLSVVVIGALHTANLDLMAVKNHGDSIQAHYLALAGIEKAKALLYQDAKQRTRSGKNHSGELYDAPDRFRDVKFGRGQFSILRQAAREEGGKLIYGISDEESRLNVNTATAEDLLKLYGMTPEIAAAIMDWRDTDDNVSPNGAEVGYYASLQPPVMPRNGPLQTARELLMVRGVTRDLFMGEDTNQNGLLDRNEDDGKESPPLDNHDGVLDAGWSGALTVDSLTANVNAAGEDRVNIQSAAESDLAGVSGIAGVPGLAKAIVEWRGQSELKTLADLLDVQALAPASQAPQNQPVNPQPGQPVAQPGSPNPSGAPQGQPNRQPVGDKLINEDLLMTIADDLTAASDEPQAGLVNVNTATLEVLKCLPGITEELAQAIVNYRQSSGFLPNVAWLLKVPGMSREIFKQAAPRMCVRSETFRILSEGTVPSTGARKRIQAIVRVSIGSSEAVTLSWREDL